MYYGLDIENINDIVFKDTFEYLSNYHAKDMYTLVISEFQEYKTNYILKNITVYTTEGIFVFEPVFVDWKQKKVR